MRHRRIAGRELRLFVRRRFDRYGNGVYHCRARGILLRNDAVLSALGNNKPSFGVPLINAADIYLLDKLNRQSGQQPVGFGSSFELVSSSSFEV
jgi:hypothetical protein